MDADRKSVLRSSYMMMGAVAGFIAGMMLSVVWIVWLAYYFKGDASPLFWRLAMLGSELLLATSILSGIIVGRVLSFRRIRAEERQESLSGGGNNFKKRDHS